MNVFNMNTMDEFNIKFLLCGTVAQHNNIKCDSFEFMWMKRITQDLWCQTCELFPFHWFSSVSSLHCHFDIMDDDCYSSRSLWMQSGLKIAKILVFFFIFLLLYSVQLVKENDQADKIVPNQFLYILIFFLFLKCLYVFHSLNPHYFEMYSLFFFSQMYNNKWFAI